MRSRDHSVYQRLSSARAQELMAMDYPRKVFNQVAPAVTADRWASLDRDPRDFYPSARGKALAAPAAIADSQCVASLEAELAAARAEFDRNRARVHELKQKHAELRARLVAGNKVHPPT